MIHKSQPMIKLATKCINMANEAVSMSNQPLATYKMNVAIAAVFLEHCLKNNILLIDKE